MLSFNRVCGESFRRDRARMKGVGLDRASLNMLRFYCTSADLAGSQPRRRPGASPVVIAPASSITVVPTDDAANGAQNS